MTRAATNTMTTIRYSPKPIKSYEVPSKSQILSIDEEAWNLAYLSFDFDSKAFHPDPHFSTHVRRTIQFVISTGQHDLAGEMPEKTVRRFLQCPPPQAAMLIMKMRLVEQLPLFKAYGEEWIKTVMQRSRLYREPHDKKLDAPINDCSEAIQLIQRLYL